MLQVATIDGKLDGALADLTRRVKVLEDKDNGSVARTVTVIAVVFTGLGLLMTIAGKINWL